MNIDLIAALESLDYTKREATFLYLVAAHSGYFLRRQFNYFIDRQNGFLAHRFVEKAVAEGHIQTLDYGRGVHVYHLFSKPIYRLLGTPESQNRRHKGDASVRSRLMKLDYVLENEEEHFLASDEERHRFFSEVRKIGRQSLSAVAPFCGNFPIGVADSKQPDASLVRFAFIDEGLSSTRKYARFLSSMTPLLREMRRFELVYVACSSFNFPAAEQEFTRRFRPIVSPEQRVLAPSFNAEKDGGAAHSRPLRHAEFVSLLFNYNYPPMQRSELLDSAKHSEAVSE